MVIFISGSERPGSLKMLRRAKIPTIMASFWNIANEGKKENESICEKIVSYRKQARKGFIQ